MDPWVAAIFDFGYIIFIQIHCVMQYLQKWTKTEMRWKETFQLLLNVNRKFWQFINRQEYSDFPKQNTNRRKCISTNIKLAIYLTYALIRLLFNKKHFGSLSVNESLWYICCWKPNTFHFISVNFWNRVRIFLQYYVFGKKHGIAMWTGHSGRFARQYTARVLHDK